MALASDERKATPEPQVLPPVARKVTYTTFSRISERLYYVETLVKCHHLEANTSSSTMAHTLAQDRQRTEHGGRRLFGLSDARICSFR